MKDPWRYLKLAAEVANLKDDQRSFRLGAVGIRSDGVLVAAYNGPSFQKTAALHAEARLTRKMDYHGVVYVARTKAEGLGLARPCASCQRALRRKRVRRVYYTISSEEYGVLEL